MKHKHRKKTEVLGVRHPLPPPIPTPLHPIDGKTMALSEIEEHAFEEHRSDLRGMERTRENLENHRTNVQRLLRILEGQIGMYDKVLQMVRSRAKEQL